MTTRRFLQLDVFSRAPVPATRWPWYSMPRAWTTPACRPSRAGRACPKPPSFPAAGRRCQLPAAHVQPAEGSAVRRHPSVGTAHAVLQAGLAKAVDGVLVQDGIAGALPLRISGEGAQQRIAIRTPRAQLAEIAEATDPRLQAALKDWPLGTLPPARMQGGRSWWLVQVANEAALRALHPDWDAVAALAESTDSMGVFAYAFSEAARDSTWPCVPSSAMAGASRTPPRVLPMQCWPRGWTCARPCPTAVHRSKSARAARSATMRA